MAKSAHAVLTLVDGSEVAIGPLNFQVDYTEDNDEEISASGNTQRANRAFRDAEALFAPAEDEEGNPLPRRAAPSYQGYTEDGAYVVVAAERVQSVRFEDR